jgi:hypothetical protein
MSPRVTPITADPPARRTEPDPAIVAVTEGARLQRGEKLLHCSVDDPYMPGCPHSFFRDLLRVSQQHRRADDALERALEHGGRASVPDELPLPVDRDDSLVAVRRRLQTIEFAENRSRTYTVLKRDLSSSNAADVLRPSAPGYLASVFGRASRQTGMLGDVFKRVPIEPGMVDTSSGVPVVSLPRLATGAALAVQSAQNAAVQETDPTTGSATSPLATIAGQVDMSGQLFEFPKPGMDAVIADDLGRDFGAKFDTQIVNGSAASGQTRGLLNWSGILSVAGTVTSAATFLESIWKAYSLLAGPSGYGNANPDDYVVVLAPRRLAWVRGNTTGIPAQALFPGLVVPSSGIPTNLGAGTNEDVALVVERSAVLLLADSARRFRADESTGSGTLTVRTSAWASAALLVNAAAIAKVTGLTPPSGF